MVVGDHRSAGPPAQPTHPHFETIHLQANGGTLDAQQAARLVNGLAGPVPPPYMEGLVLPGAGAAAPAPARPVPSPPAFASHTPQGAFPPLTPDQAAAFQVAFAQLDADGDGYVQGVDCFPAFMQSGLPKAALKEVWDLVAGEAGQLSAHQFVQVRCSIKCPCMQACLWDHFVWDQLHSSLLLDPRLALFVLPAPCIAGSIWRAGLGRLTMQHLNLYAGGLICLPDSCVRAVPVPD